MPAATTSSARSSSATTRRRSGFFQFALSGFFAGIAGGLYALTYEIVTFDTVAGGMSANALLMTFIGGVGTFFGPVLGAILIVLLQSWVSLLSNSWLLYVGVLFILMVTFAPGGIAGLVLMHQPIARSGRMGRLAVPYARIAGPGLFVVVGFVLLDRAVLLPHHRRLAGQDVRARRGHDRSEEPGAVGDRRAAARRRAASGSGARGAACARRGTR